MSDQNLKTQETESFRKVLVWPIIVSLGVVLLMLAASAYMWVNLPADAMLPDHFDIHGNANHFVGKTRAALFMPGVALAVTILLPVIAFIEPRRRHLLQSSKAFIAVRLGVVFMLGAIHINVMLGVLGRGIDPTVLVNILLGLLFMVIGYYLPRIHSTFFLGIRTPWTLSSDRVWEKTHRLGGRLYLALGLGTLAFILLGLRVWGIAFSSFGAVSAALFLVVYSYLLWRGEQKALASAGGGEPDESATGTLVSKVLRGPFILSLVLVALMLVFSAVMWVNLPADATLPMSVDIHGNPGDYTGKLPAALSLPAVVLGITILMIVRAVIEPRRRHLVQSRKPYSILWLGAVVLLTAVHVNGMLLALGHGMDMLRLVGGMVGLILIVGGNYMGKIRSAFFVGISTPWTLSSDQVWDKTHRLAGLFYVGVGLVTLVLAATDLKALALGVGVAGAIASTVILVVYSYFAWRGEQNVNASRH